MSFLEFCAWFIVYTSMCKTTFILCSVEMPWTYRFGLLLRIATAVCGAKYLWEIRTW